MGMRFSRKGALGIATPVLLGSVLVAGAAALPANAKSWQDTALAAGQVQVATFAGRAPAPATRTLPSRTGVTIPSAPLRLKRMPMPSALPSSS